MNGRAPYSSVTGFHKLENRNPIPNFSRAGAAYRHNSKISRAVTTKIAAPNTKVTAHATSSAPRSRPETRLMCGVTAAAAMLFDLRDLLLLEVRDLLRKRSVAQPL